MKNPLILALSVRPFLYLLLSEIFSQIAMNLVNFILLIVAFSVSHSNTAVAGVVLSFTIPSILFGLLAGVYVDRWNKKNVLFATNLLRALFIFPLVFLNQSLVSIYVLSFLVAVATQFFIPAEAPIIPHLVPRKLLLSANSLFSLVIFGSILIAYAASGPIILFFGQTNVFWLLTGMFVVSAIFSFLIKLKVPKREETTELNIKDDIKGAVSIMSKTKSVYHALFLLTLLQTLVLVIAVIGPGYAENILKIDVKSFPLLFVTPAVLGMGLGAVMIGNFLHTKPKSLITKIGLFILGIDIMLFPYGSKLASRDIIQTLNTYLPQTFSVDILHIMIVMAFILGFAFAFVFIPSNTILQEESSDETRGKIYGSLNALVGVISFIPVLAAGGLADLFGVGTVLTMIGIFVLTIAIARLTVD